MSDNTKIEWADATVNAVNGCSLASPGCTNCYAMRLAGTRMKHHPSRAGLTMDTKAGPVWTGEVRLHEPALLQPLRWKRPRQIFWNAHGDLFHPAVPDEWIDRVFAVCTLTPHHTHMILTKRAARMRAYVQSRLLGADLPGHAILNAMDGISREPWPTPLLWPLPNVWLGVSVEDQARADERAPDLLATPAAMRFISAEPLLGPVDLQRWLHIMWRCSYCREFFDGRHRQHCPGCGKEGGLCGSHPFNGRHRPDRPGFPYQSGSGLDWVIVGGESGPGARPMHPDWARSLRDQCADAGVPFHFKQWGEWSADETLPIAANARDCPQGTIEVHGPVWGVAGHGRSVTVLRKVGKAAAGRLLDGVEHNGMPEVRS